MSKIELKQRISSGVLILDGAMGTQLIARGAEPGQCNEELNITSDSTVIEVQQAYADAGSDAIITNTFGANKYSLSRHGLAEKVAEINTRGAENARKVAGEDRYVIGGIGPSGGFLEPLGDLKADELKQAFADQAKALADGGVDGFIVETMTAIEEVTIAVEAVQSVSDLPVFASLSYDKAGDDFKTMMGIGVDAAVAKLVPLGVAAIGFNCGTVSLDDYIKLAEKHVAVLEQVSGEAVLLAEPNAGLPTLVEDKAIYDISPEVYAKAAQKIHDLGFNILGGCCGTSPAHIQAVAEKLKG